MSKKDDMVEHPLWWGCFMLVVSSTFFYQFLYAPMPTAARAVLGVLVVASVAITLYIFNALLREWMKKQEKRRTHKPEK